MHIRLLQTKLRPRRAFVWQVCCLSLISRIFFNSFRVRSTSPIPKYKTGIESNIEVDYVIDVRLCPC